MTACARCQKVVVLEAADEDGGLVDLAEARVGVEGGGLLLAICSECMTKAEMLESARQSAATLLDMAEEALANIEMIMERIPRCEMDPQIQASHAEATAHVVLARTALATLLQVEESDE